MTSKQRKILGVFILVAMYVVLFWIFPALSCVYKAYTHDSSQWLDSFLKVELIVHITIVVSCIMTFMVYKAIQLISE